MSYLPARVGDAVSEVETPALLLDLDVAERNIVKLQEMTAGTRAVPRPHAKSHKCPNLARLQIAYGAVGVCSQKVNEAVALVDGGVSDVLLSNQVVDPAKQRRLVNMARSYLLGLGGPAPPCRFDVVGVTAGHGRPPVLDVVRDAFAAHAP